MTCHQYGKSALVPETSFRGKTSVDVAKCRLFSQAIEEHTSQWMIKKSKPEHVLCSTAHTQVLIFSTVLKTQTADLLRPSRFATRLIGLNCKTSWYDYCQSQYDEWSKNKNLNMFGATEHILRFWFSAQCWRIKLLTSYDLRALQPD